MTDLTRWSLLQFFFLSFLLCWFCSHCTCLVASCSFICFIWDHLEAIMRTNNIIIGVQCNKTKLRKNCFFSSLITWMIKQTNKQMDGWIYRQTWAWQFNLGLLCVELEAEIETIIRGSSSILQILCLLSLPLSHAVLWNNNKQMQATNCLFACLLKYRG